MVAKLRCPFFHEDLVLGTGAECARCGAPHHTACFAELPGCAATGCGGRTVTPSLRPRASNMTCAVMAIHALSLAGVAAALGVAGLVASNLDRANNPAFRGPETWTLEDLGRLFHDPDLHWCGGQHGHVDGRGPATRCKGSCARVMIGVERLHRGDTAAEDLVIGLIGDPSPDIASRAAETLGAWGLARAAPKLLKETRRRLEGRDPGQRIVVICMLWSLEQVPGSPGEMDELADLQSLASTAGLVGGPATYGLQHTLAALRLGHPCGCPAPHRR
jgi:hypothetical protein